MLRCAARRIFNSLLGVWMSADETLSLVFDILLHACIISFLSRAFAKLDSKKLEPKAFQVLYVKFWQEEQRIGRLAVLLASNSFAGQ